MSSIQPGKEENHIDKIVAIAPSLLAHDMSISASSSEDKMNDKNKKEKDEKTISTTVSAGITTSAVKVKKAFVFVRHAKHGFLLLKAFKKRKGTHYQIPGGRIDESDSSPAYAAARELFEETGIDIRSHELIVRLEPLLFPDGSLVFEKRQYFALNIDDNDPILPKIESSSDASKGPPTLRLSKEHIGAEWVSDTLKAADMVSKYVYLCIYFIHCWIFLMWHYIDILVDHQAMPCFNSLLAFESMIIYCYHLLYLLLSLLKCNSYISLSPYMYIQ